MSNSSPNNIAALYLGCAEELQDAPVKIITVLGVHGRSNVLHEISSISGSQENIKLTISNEIFDRAATSVMEEE